MIARFWQARTRPGMGESYLDYFRETGLRDFNGTAGFRGALTLRREVGAESEYIILSLWDDMAAVRGFAGPDPERAVYYPSDARYFPESELRPLLVHYEVAIAEPDPGAEVGSGAAPAGFPAER